MAFKSVTAYNEERYGKFFMLRNDGDSADVVFLYRNVNDVLVADVHYIKSDMYTGYAHCLGKGCPACNYGERGIRIQTKLFIPVYNIDANEIQFFDRTMRFEPQLMHDVFDMYDNPSQCVYRIIRHGAAGSVDTTYEIKLLGKNTLGTYEEILNKFGASFPEYYNQVCRELTSREMSDMLGTSNTNHNHSPSSYSTMPEYTPQPRVSIPSPAMPSAAPEFPPVDEIDNHGSNTYDDLGDSPVEF